MWGVALTSFFMDCSSEMVLILLPLYLHANMKAPTTVIGLIEGVALMIASFLKVLLAELRVCADVSAGCEDGCGVVQLCSAAAGGSVRLLCAVHLVLLIPDCNNAANTYANAFSQLSLFLVRRCSAGG